MKYLIMGALALSGLLVYQPSFSQTKWVTPPAFRSVKNPIAGNAASITSAKAIYTSTCAPCHGKKGRGDGPAAIALNPKPADYTAASIQAETDGSLFWKMTTGRGAMQSYKATLTDQQRWGLVNYIRTFRK
ncbi:MAG: cytochrome c [Chitinophagaceae bacterium]